MCSGKWFNVYILKGSKENVEVSMYCEKSIKDISTTQKMPMLLTYYFHWGCSTGGYIYGYDSYCNYCYCY